MPEDRVYGVLYEIDDAEKPALDRAEGSESGYAEKYLQVMTDIGQVTARAYYATKKNTSLKPYHWYKDLVLAGACDHSLPTNYVEVIERVDSFKDSNSARCVREREGSRR